MTLESLATFLEAANKATYANRTMPKAPSTRAGSLDYHFEQGGLAYHDTYFGVRDFIGAEVVYDNGAPAWGMNYFGFILDEGVSEKDVYAFLRTALMQFGGDVIPVRGPRQYDEDGKSFRLTITGGLANFFGTEEIHFAGKVVYRCHVHGGLIR
ncbi:MAG: hypothetical protein K2Y40_05740 [Reyranella sp.]|nr:hypothetical protein [Reyranella sp.]